MSHSSEYASNLLGSDSRKKLGVAPWRGIFSSPIGFAHVINCIFGAGFSTQIAMVPFLLMELNLPIEYNAYILAFNGTLQFLSAMFFGIIADRVGPRNTFLIVLWSSLLCYALMALSMNLAMLLISQIPTCCMHGFQATNYLLSIETTEDQRTSAIGYSNLSFGTGILVGSLMTAYVSSFSGPRGAIIVMALIAAFGCSLAFQLDRFDGLQAPQSLTDNNAVSSWIESFSESFKAFLPLTKRLLPICGMTTMGLLPTLVVRFSITAVSIDRFNLDSQKAAALVGYVAVITLAWEGLAAPFLSDFLDDLSIIMYSTILTLSGFILEAFLGNRFSLMMLCLIPLLAGGALTYVCGTSQMTKRASQQQFGAALGLNAAIFYLLAGCGPYALLIVYSKLGMKYYWLLGVALSCLSAIYIFTAQFFCSPL